MSKIYVPYLAVFICLAFPPLLLVAIPAGLVYLTTKGAQGRKLHRQRQVFLNHQIDQNLYKACRGLK